MTIRIYGTLDSRAARCLWMARELKVPHETIPIDWRDCSKEPAFLTINPYGMIPALEDGDLRLSESMAINDYLLRRYGNGSPLAPANAKEDAAITQWTFWTVTQVEKPMVQFLCLETNVRPVSSETIAAARADLQRPLTYLNDHLSKERWLIGSRFTAADLNTASVVEWARPGKFDLTSWPHVSDWLNRCIARPAFQGLSMAPVMRAPADDIPDSASYPSRTPSGSTS
jgi:glutathione S-transferase